MIWKILFVLLSLLVMFVNFTFGNLGEASLYLLLAFVLLDFVYAVVLANFFSLGWKKRFYSVKTTNILFGVVILFVIFSIVQSVHAGLPIVILNLKATMAENVTDNSLYLSAILTLSLVSFILYSLMWSPAIVSFFKYKKHFDLLEPVSKRFYLISVLYMAAVVSLPLIAGLLVKG